jgi:hypothetical protein
MSDLKKLCLSCGIKKLNLVYDKKTKSLTNLLPGFCNPFLAQLDDKRYCALIIHHMNMQVADNVRREGKRQPDFTYDGLRLFIGPAEKMEEVKIIGSKVIHGHWFVKAEGVFLYYFRKTDGIPDKPYDEYSFAEKDGVFHVIPPEKVFRGMPLY